MVSSSYNALHQHLKLATAAAHSSLECVLAKRGYFDGREQYIHYLQRFLAFQDEAEQVLDTSITVDAVPDWSERRRAHLARADLEILGAPVRAFPRSCGRLPQVASHEQVLGIVYVLEGSTLGGAYLLRQLAPLGITQAQVARISRATGAIAARCGSGFSSRSRRPTCATSKRNRSPQRRSRRSRQPATT